MGMAALGLQMAGVGMSLMGSYNQAEAQQQTLNYEASVAANNAAIANYQAGLALTIGQQNEEAERERTAATFSDQRAAMAANGVDLGTGSPTEVLASTKLVGERDALTIRDNAARQAWAYRNNAASYLSEKSADEATKGAISPTGAALGSLLTGAGAVASSWYRYTKTTSGTPGSGGSPSLTNVFAM